MSSVVSGYSGGQAETAKYEAVGSGDTGHAESVRIGFDPQKISYGRLLQIYFSVAHNPTELNRQRPDRGTQYPPPSFRATPNRPAWPRLTSINDRPKVENLKRLFPAVLLVQGPEGL